MDGITDSLSKLQELVKDREPWHAAVHGVTKSQKRLATEQQQQSGISSSSHSSPASNLSLTPRQSPGKTQHLDVEHMEHTHTPPPRPTVCFCASHLHTSDLAQFSAQICKAVLQPLFTDKESSLRWLRNLFPPTPPPHGRKSCVSWVGRTQSPPPLACTLRSPHAPVQTKLATVS